MKKLVLMLCFILVNLFTGSAQDYLQVGNGGREIAKGLHLIYRGNGYCFRYEIPSPVERVVETDSGLFSIVEFPYDVEKSFELSNIEYDMLTEVGYPALPVISVNINLPNTIPTLLGYDIIGVSDLQYIDLQYPYLPAQNQEYEDMGGEFIINKAFYNGTEPFQMSNDFVELSKPYSFYGLNGLTVHISPISYNPEYNVVGVPRYLEFDIPGITLDALVDMYHICSFFDTRFLYDIYRHEELKRPKYAVFTIPMYESSMLRLYMDYKHRCGYSVHLYSSNAYCDNRALLDAIRRVYADPATRPLYVLLVGHYSQLPFASGLEDSYYSPPSDFEYAHFDSEEIDDYAYPDVPVGRWPVRNGAELANIVEKTINFEHELYLKNKKQCRISLFSGTGNNQGYFAQDIKYIAKCLNVLRLNVGLYDGREFGKSYDITPMTAVKQELCSQPWMFLYRGHGNDGCIGSPYSLCNDMLYELCSDSVLPMSFLFGCSMNYLFGVDWISTYSNKGGVSCFAPTVSIATNVNRKVSRGIFERFKNEEVMRPHITIYSLISTGIAKYLSSYGNDYEKYVNASKYVFYGDPSMRIRGGNVLDFNSMLRESHPSIDFFKRMSYGNGERSDAVRVNIQKIKDDVTVYSDDISVADVRIFDMAGRCVMSLEHTVLGTPISLSNLVDGIYVMVVRLCDGTVERKK